MSWSQPFFGGLLITFKRNQAVTHLNTCSMQYQRPYLSSCDLPISTRWQAGRRCMRHASYFSELGCPTRWKLSQRRSCWQWPLMSNDCNWMCVASWCGRFYLSCKYSKECDWFWAIIIDLSGTLFWPYFRFGFFFPILVQNLVNLLNMPLGFS